MKKFTFIAICLFVFKGLSVFAQTDVTDTYLTNPSFETGDNTGWTITSAAESYSWLGPNDDGDDTKDGTYITGLWNISIGDVEWSQSLTGLTNGTYTVSCLMTVSTGSANARLSTQRLFANGKSILYASESDYDAADLAILSASETLSYGGYTTSAAENGPFYSMSVSVEVTDGTLELGVRVNGAASESAFSFQGDGTDIGFFKWDNMTLTLESATAISTSNILNGKVYASVSAINVETDGNAKVNVYSITGRLLNSIIVDGTASIPTSKGVYLITVNGIATKVVVTK